MSVGQASRSRTTFCRQYWTAFANHLRSKGTEIRHGEPPQNWWMGFSLGGPLSKAMHLAAGIGNDYLHIRVVLKDDFCSYFDELEAERSRFEKRLALDDAKLSWRKAGRDVRPNGRPLDVECHVAELRYDGVDPYDESDWPRQHEILRGLLVKYYEVFYPVYKSLSGSH